MCLKSSRSSSAFEVEVEFDCGDVGQIIHEDDHFAHRLGESLQRTGKGMGPGTDGTSASQLSPSRVTSTV